MNPSASGFKSTCTCTLFHLLSRNHALTVSNGLQCCHLSTSRKACTTDGLNVSFNARGRHGRYDRRLSRLAAHTCQSRARQLSSLLLRRHTRAWSQNIARSLRAFAELDDGICANRTTNSRQRENDVVPFSNIQQRFLVYRAFWWSRLHQEPTKCVFHL